MGDYLQEIYSDKKYCITKEYPKYKEVKGYKHTWNSGQTINGAYISSVYRKEKKLQFVTITATYGGWVVQFTRKLKSWFVVFDNIEECIECGELFFDNKLIMDQFE